MPVRYKISSIIFPIVVCFCLNRVNAQKNLTREEIFDRWTKEKGVLHLTEKEGLDKFIDCDTLLNAKIYTALKELEQSNVDTLGLFIASYPGFYSLHPSCYSGYYPVDAYLFWQSGGVAYSEKITGKCENTFKSNDSVKKIFNFYANNSKQIDSEYLMPVIFNGSIDSKGDLKYGSIFIDHEPNYFIFCKLSTDVKFLNFTKDGYTNKKSVFLKYNLQSKSYILFRQIDSLFRRY